MTTPAPAPNPFRLSSPLLLPPSTFTGETDPPPPPKPKPETLSTVAERLMAGKVERRRRPEERRRRNPMDADDSRDDDGKPANVSIARAKKLGTEYYALELRARGLTYREIGAELDIDPRKAQALVARAAATTPIENGLLVLNLELSRLDRMLAALADDIEAGDVRAIEAALKVMDRRAKMLGLDAPKKHTVEGGVTFTLELGDKVIEVVDAEEVAVAEVGEVGAVGDTREISEGISTDSTGIR